MTAREESIFIWVEIIKSPRNNGEVYVPLYGEMYTLEYYVHPMQLFKILEDRRLLT